MTLNNFYFLFFWAGSLALLVLLQRLGAKIQKLALVLLSFVFVAFTDVRFCAAVFITAVFIFFVGRRIASTEGSRQKGWLITGLVYLIGLLLFFKYANFFLDALSNAWGIGQESLRFVMPLGLSYYTFSSVTYLVDVYRGTIPVETDFSDMAIFLAFFPKMTAGPIAKARDFLPQLKCYPGIRWENLEAGVQIFVIGLFKKIVLADHLKVFVDDVFWAPTAYHSATIVLAVISYSLQIYLDFAGYSDMAIGVARTLGIELPANFNFPYLASDISEFWTRWHISLSSFLREYIYYPLGGNRRGRVRTYVNLMLVMLISGAWHGNGATFLVWGFLHGCASCIHRALRGRLPEGKLWRTGGIAWNFVVVSLFWIFFRASDMGNALAIAKGMLVYQEGIRQPYLWTFFAIAVCVAAACVSYAGKRKDRYPVQKLESVKAWTIFLTFTGLTVMLGYYGNTVFIYGGF